MKKIANVILSSIKALRFSLLEEFIDENDDIKSLEMLSEVLKDKVKTTLLLTTFKSYEDVYVGSSFEEDAEKAISVLVNHLKTF